MNKGKIIVISGPSGVGKKTILDQVMQDSELNLKYSISMTTRNKRVGEEDGVDYYFVSNEEFDNAIKDNELIEWATFCNNKYGTPKSKLIERISQGINVILEIEVIGALKILDMFKKEELLSIFIAPPSLEDLKSRLLNRGTEDCEVIERRITRAVEELKNQCKYQFVVTNDDAFRAANEIKTIIRTNIYHD